MKPEAIGRRIDTAESEERDSFLDLLASQAAAGDQQAINELLRVTQQHDLSHSAIRKYLYRSDDIEAVESRVTYSGGA